MAQSKGEQSNKLEQSIVKNYREEPVGFSAEDGLSEIGFDDDSVMASRLANRRKTMDPRLCVGVSDKKRMATVACFGRICGPGSVTSQKYSLTTKDSTASQSGIVT